MAWHTLSDSCAELIPDGAAVMGYSVDRGVATPQYNPVTHIEARLIRDVRGNHIHRYGAYQRDVTRS